MSIIEMSKNYDELSEKWIRYYMQMAELTSLLSSAIRLKVGSVLVKNNRVLATGYNGTPSGWDNNCENKDYMARDAGGWLDIEEIEERWPHEDEHGRYLLKTKPEVLHSEMNCLMHVARSTESSLASTMFCTHSPCLDCAKAIYQAGVNKFYWRTAYRDNGGIDFLEKSGVTVINYRNS